MNRISRLSLPGFSPASMYCLFVVIAFVPAAALQAQWEDPVIINDPVDSAHTSYTNTRCIAASGNYIHAVWSQKSVDQWLTSYARSTDGGGTWEAPVALTTPGVPIRGQSPSIAVSGSDVHLVWVDQRSGTRVVFHRCSKDNGDTWSEPTALMSTTDECYVPSIVASGIFVFVAWTRSDMLGKCIMLRRSTDGGASWEAEVPICDSYWAEAPALAVSDGIVHVTWYDSRFGPMDVFYRHSTDLGATWDEEVRITAGPMANTGMAIDAAGNDVHLVWHKYEAGYWNIHYRYSWDGGVSWGADDPITSTNPISYFPSISVSGQHLHVVWVDARAGVDIFYAYSSDAGVNWYPEFRLTDDTARSLAPFICTSGNTVHALWTDDYRRITYRRNPTGNAGIIPVTMLRQPEDVTLSSCYPHPVAATGYISYTLPEERGVRLTLHDLLGRCVSVLEEGTHEPGTHRVRIDAGGLPAGSYLCRLTCGTQQRTRLITVLR